MFDELLYKIIPSTELKKKIGRINLILNLANQGWNVVRRSNENVYCRIGQQVTYLDKHFLINSFLTFKINFIPIYRNVYLDDAVSLFYQVLWIISLFELLESVCTSKIEINKMLYYITNSDFLLHVYSYSCCMVQGMSSL